MRSKRIGFVSEYDRRRSDRSRTSGWASAPHKIIGSRGAPSITVGNGTEFASKAMDHWAYLNGVHLDFIRPGRPVENGYIAGHNLYAFPR